MEGISTGGFQLSTHGTSFGLTGNHFPRLLTPGAAGKRGPPAFPSGSKARKLEGERGHRRLPHCTSSSPGSRESLGRELPPLPPMARYPRAIPPREPERLTAGIRRLRILYSSPASPRSSRSRDSIRSRKGDSSSFASGLSRLSLSISSSRGLTPARSITSSST